VRQAPRALYVSVLKMHYQSAKVGRGECGRLLLLQQTAGGAVANLLVLQVC
jgi:hypothetical protein